MKRGRKRNYWHFFRKHFLVLLVVWIILCYMILQGLYFYLFARIEQKSTANFYEGMETIQYVTKDASLKEVETEIMHSLGNMSNTGNYALYSGGGYYPGTIMGLRLDALDVFLDLGMGGHGHDGNGNTYLGGNGRGWGFVMDEETGELVCGTLGEKPENILFLVDEEINQKHYQNNSVVYYGAGTNLLRCDSEKLNPVYEILTKIKEEQWEKLLAVNPDAAVGKRLNWQLQSFYVKGDVFYPARVSLYYISTDYKTRNENPDEFITDYTFASPEEGYALYEPNAEKERIFALFMDSTPSDKNEANRSDANLWRPDDDFRKEALEGIKEINAKGRTQDLGDAWSLGNPLLYFLSGKMVFARYAYFSDSTGHAYKACIYQTISDIFVGNSGNIKWWAGVLGIWMLILGLITSYLEYNRKRYEFMTAEYRRTLMDSMAHDLKSPLMAISGYAENLSEHINDDKREHYVREIQSSVEYMNSLVMKNLEIMKFAREKHRMHIQTVDMKSLFEEAFGRYREQVGEHKLHIKMEGEMTVKGDEELLRKAVDNLVTNAITYSSDEGEISVFFGKKTLEIRNQSDIEYTDKLSRLWEPFVRGDESRNGNGTGLGLAIVANILDRHGWKYSLKYEKETKVFICTVKVQRTLFIP